MSLNPIKLTILEALDRHRGDGSQHLRTATTLEDRQYEQDMVSTLKRHHDHITECIEWVQKNIPGNVERDTPTEAILVDQSID